MQPQTVQHGTRALHDAQNGNGEEKPHVKGNDGHDDAEGAGHLERVADGHAPQHDRELLMCEGEGPQAEVRRGVGDTVETEFCVVVSVGFSTELGC